VALEEVVSHGLSRSVNISGWPSRGHILDLSTPQTKAPRSFWVRGIANGSWNNSPRDWLRFGFWNLNLDSHGSRFGRLRELLLHCS